MKSRIEKKARAYAKRHGFQVRRIPHSQAHPNGYIRITTPDGTEKTAHDWIDAYDEMMIHHLRKADR